MSTDQPPNPYGQQPPPGPPPGPLPGPRPGYGYPQQQGIPPEQNPYAQPVPPDQNPYAQPVPPGQSPYAPSAGAPNPYGQQPVPPGPGPYGGQPEWGGQVPPPPGKSRTGRILAIAAAVVVLVGAGIAVAVASVSSSGHTTASGGAGSPAGAGGGVAAAAQYKLTTPQTLADGYTIQGSGETAAPSGGQDLPGVGNPTAVVGTYQDGDQKLLSFAGDYGTVSDPGTVVDAAFTAVKTDSATAGKFAFTGTAAEEHPSGFDGSVMKCQQITVDSALPGAMCVWGDSSTVGEVILMDPKAAINGGGGPPDLNAAADLTAKVRQIARVRIS